MTEETTVETTEEDAPNSEEVETEAESNDETAEGSTNDEEENAEDSSDSDGEDSTAEKPKKVNKTQKRINELTAQMRQFERERDFYKSQVPESQPDQSQLPPRPTLDQFDYDDVQFQEATLKWAQQVREIEENHKQQTRLKEQQELALAQAKDSYNTRAQEFAESHPDFEAVTTNRSLPVSQAMAQGVLIADNGPELLYHLGKNPELAATLSKLPPASQLMELGRLGAELSAKTPQQKTVSNAPSPITPVSSKGKIQKEPSEMTDKEFSEWRKKQIAARPNY